MHVLSFCVFYSLLLLLVWVQTLYFKHFRSLNIAFCDLFYVIFLFICYFLRICQFLVIYGIYLLSYKLVIYYVWGDLVDFLISFQDLCVENDEIEDY